MSWHPARTGFFGVPEEFRLRQNPLTYLAAPTPSGAASTLEVRVNDILWPEAGNLLALGRNDRGYVTRTDDDGVTAIIFGNGERGTRLPTGVENINAAFRSGIGAGDGHGLRFIGRAILGNGGRRARCGSGR